MLDVKPVTAAAEHKCESNHYSFIASAIMRVDIQSDIATISFLLCRNCAINLAALLQEQVRNFDNSKI